MITESGGEGYMQEQEEARLWGAHDVSSSKGMKDENFPVGSFLIAPRVRPAVHAYYRFARIADDMVDNAQLSATQKVDRLTALRDVLYGRRRPPAGRADGWSAVVLRTVLQEHGLPLEVGGDLITAFIMDAEKARYEHWSELLHYCRYSANPVGRFLLMLHKESEETFGPSDALCTALQIVNHMQDVKGDLKTLNRCYVPLPWLAAENVGIEDLLLARSKPGVRRVFDQMLAHVDALNEEAARLPALVKDRRMRLEAAVIVALCRRLSARLRHQDPIAERVALTKLDGLRALSWAMRYIR